MVNYLRDSLHWMYLAFFKPYTLAEETGKFTWKQTITTFLEIYPIAATTYFLLLLAAWGLASLAGYSVTGEIFRPLVVMLAFGLGIGILGAWLEGLQGGVESVQFSMLLGGLIIGLQAGLDRRLLFGVLLGLLAGQINRPLLGLGVGLGIGLIFGLFFGLRNEGIDYALVFLTVFCLTYFRPFYLIPYVIKYQRAKIAEDPFLIFRNSPVHWDEVIAIPLPYLRYWLVDLVKHNRERGLGEILYIAEKCPYQRKAAFRALITVAERDLQGITKLHNLAKAADLLKAFPTEDKVLPKGLDDARWRLRTISETAQDYQSRLTPEGQLRMLESLQGELKSFRSAMTLTAGPVGKAFRPLAGRWLKMVEEAEAKALARLNYIGLQNPYVAGAPLRPSDHDLLKGQSEIVRKIERYILNTDQRPSLLLYGRRRTGKSSTLLNLPLLLSSQLEPVYIDCQDSKWNESDQAFCYNLAREIFDKLSEREIVKGVTQPQLEQFEKNAFTHLDQYLDKFERLATKRGKRILLAFDEYEGLEESIAGGDVSKNILGKLRNIIQHRERIVVLVSGSHHFEELPRLNWASYLINTRTLELSFLDEQSARELLTEPVPQLRYEDGVLDEILWLTHCQPYLLQAVASELVNHLNDRQQTMATDRDLDAAVNKVLISANAYFENTLFEDNSKMEQTVLCAFAAGAGDNVVTEEYLTTLQSLCRKELMERTEEGYRLAVPLFGLWILKNQVAEELPAAKH